MDNLATVDVVIIVGFLVIVSLVGFAMSKVASQGMEDYFLGGKRIPWWVLGASTASSNFDMAGTMIIVAVVFVLGYKGFLVEIRGGVGLSLAFLMIFLGKWLRRSRVMTSAEWMKIRFGTDTQGKAAHILSAAANLVLSLGMIVYFAKGAGKFLVYFIPIPELYCTAAMVGVGLFYTLTSGLYGVVFTDVIQMILLTFTAIFVTVHAYSMTPEVQFAEGFLSIDLESATAIGQPLIERDADTWGPILDMFGICVLMWCLRTTLEGMGGVGGYTDQRFFAARNEREAGLLTLESVILSVFRWTMVAGLVVMGLHTIQSGGEGAALIAEDPEQLLPVVLGALLPAGIKGLVLAGLIAAAMSTFDSTLNAGAAYFVKDIYQSYLKPDANEKQLMWMSRAATIGLCVIGVALAAVVPNINQIWGLITMGIGAGLFVPLFLRWYWPRLNGFGFAAGTAVGMGAALVFDAMLGWPLYAAFPAIVGSALVAAVGVSLATPATDDELLTEFWLQINPWGLWNRYERRARERGDIDADGQLGKLGERINDTLSLFLSIPFQIGLLLAAMAFVWHDWKKMVFFGLVAGVSAAGLYLFWFKNLKTNEECDADDEYWEARRAKEPELGRGDEEE